ncbi:hypothetical protein RS130_04720 [Paraglaciecola aquimarina]|uniref:Uncharacterized protein n=1 Tax=Paraglaciecola aquimarina TaxID=1235557 RepID=A0ABU3STI8_9ALTE|nr:hypothetical protein [Paraglaciecola aquimarina]MDU0353326.1 hypothetical protein [Paraglaciecola aquimarina]
MDLRVTTFSLDFVHIDVARNATDDFNLFHDKKQWDQIVNNPFGGPIALGFQLECLIEDLVKQYRCQNGELETIQQHGLKFSNYAFNFAGVVRPKDELTADIKKSRMSTKEQTILSNRVVLKNEQGIVLIGFKSESDQPLFANETSIDSALINDNIQDRNIISGSDYFYKRKFTTNSNAKNFLISSCVEQSDYLDEVNDKISFPETYCTSLISCALLERGKAEGIDFKRNPMVYTAHKISVDRHNVAKLRSDQKIHILVGPPIAEANTDSTESALIKHYCFGFNQEKEILFQGEIQLAPLSYILP